MVAGANAPLSFQAGGIDREPYRKLPAVCSQQLLRGGHRRVVGWGEEEQTRVEPSWNYFLHCLTKYGQGGGETGHMSGPG